MRILPPTPTLALVIWTLGALAFAQSPHPVVEGLRVDPEDARAVEFTVSWPHAWRNERNHDAAWIVLRGADARAGVVRLSPKGHDIAGPVEGAIEVPADRLGLFVFPAAAHRGEVSWRVRLRLEEPAPEGLRAWSVGMVHVPAGAFELGDTHPVAVALGAFHRVAQDGSVAGTLRVEGEYMIRVAPDQPGSLWYTTDENRYRGDQGGPIPDPWPKGTRAFYVMKHELSQGFYAEFLNALPPAWRDRRAPLGLEGEDTGTCSIARTADGFVASAPLRPCNFVTWDDTCALYDWLALRPMTEFEFEKAARGPRRPVPLDYPWGSAELDSLERRVTPSRDLTRAGVEDEAQLYDSSKANLGASFYWVMDLSGSLWERVVSAGHPAGRSFRGTHGDGVLGPEGNATNDDWPRTEESGRNAPGVGYRGGAEYFGPRVPDNPTNPNSPVAVRTYAGWGGAYRYKTYSARACRTAPQ